MELSQTIRDEYVRYFRHLAGRVEKAVRAVTKEKVYVKPFAFGNSIGHLVLHLTGNLNHYIGAGVAGTGYVRNRPLEFTEPNPPTPEMALTLFHAAIDMVCRTLEKQSSADWSQPISEQFPIQTRFGLFLVCLSHINNHVGQMSWLVQTLGHDSNEPPVW